ncbi:MAG: hypothetical protein K6G07_06500 [Lachnospiraceae bacterium]|nr:hypothetical protein [Lachnospiraceae bacterium]
MNNLILFVNSFLSYLLVAVIIVALGAIAITIGITMRKKSDAKAALEEKAEGTDEDEKVTEA